MASKAQRILQAPLSRAERLLWEKYSKPNRNLFQALSAFEENGVGRKVVRLPSLALIGQSLVKLTSLDALPLGWERLQGLLLYRNRNDSKGRMWLRILLTAVYVERVTRTGSRSAHLERTDNYGWQRSTNTTRIKRNMESFGIIMRHSMQYTHSNNLSNARKRTKMHPLLHSRVDQHAIIDHIMS